MVNISRFKRNISAELKAVSEGERLVILNRDKPMAPAHEHGWEH